MLNERYEPLGVLGEGGFAEVLRVRDQRLGREVALKRPLSSSTSAADVEAFQKEARMTSTLEHPSIPPLYDSDVDASGLPFLCLRMVRGRTMAEIIERLNEGDAALFEAYPYRERIAIFLKVCEAVAHAHDNGIYHRDIKPGNIMIGDLGQVFLLDWGLARREDPTVRDRADSANFFKGTLLYAPPEAVVGEPFTAQSDLYSLGATLYEWLSLRPLFEGKDGGAMLMAVLDEEPVSPYNHRHPIQGRIPIEISRFIMGTVAKNKARRPASVHAFAAQLRTWLQGEVKPECPCTVVKFTFEHLMEWVNNRPLLAPFLLLWLLYPAIALLQVLLDRLLWNVP